MGEAGREDLLVAVGGGAAPARHDVVLDLGPQHPSAHGLLQLRIGLDGDRVATCRPVVGFVHRGVEKLFEVRDYRQVMVLANRHDWLSAFASELGVALAAERMLGLEVPKRATWIRTLLAELNRILSHLAFLADFGPDGTALRPTAVATSQRERCQWLLEEVAGGRMHFMFTRVGGLKEDLPAGWRRRCAETVDGLRQALPGLSRDLLDDETFRLRTQGVGVLSADLVESFGVSGPAARASGVDFDLRRDEPYLAYDRLADVLRVPLREDGDAFARFAVLIDQVEASLDLVEACLDRIGSLPAGPVAVRLPKILRVPEGSTYAWIESPLGLNGYYLVSRGEKTPWRLKLRTASFNNVAVLAEVVPGCRVRDLVAVLASMFFVIGDIDK